MPGSTVIPVDEIESSGVIALGSKIELFMGPTVISLAVSELEPGFGNASHFVVDVQVTNCPLIGDLQGEGRLSVVSEHPLLLAGTFVVEEHSVVLGLSKSAPSRHVISYNAHQVVSSHTRNRDQLGVDTTPHSDNFVKVVKREAKKFVFYSREALHPSFCASPEPSHVMKISLVLDNGMVEALGRELGVVILDSASSSGLTRVAEAWVEALVAHVSLPFEGSFKTRIELAHITTLEKAETDGLSAHSVTRWNESPEGKNKACRFDIDTKLTQFSAWKSNLKGETTFLSAVILLTDCYSPPGVIGLANTGYACDWESSHCEKKSTRGYTHCRREACPKDTLSCFANTAVVSYVPGQTNVVLAHELAHLCGCVHTSEGGNIMSTYLGGKVSSQFNSDDDRRACGLLAQAAQKNVQCIHSLE